MMIMKNTSSPMAVGSDANIKILQDDCITISRDEYSLLLGNSIKLDMITNAITDNRYDYERLKEICHILDIPSETEVSE